MCTCDGLNHLHNTQPRKKRHKEHYTVWASDQSQPNTNQSQNSWILN